MSDIKLNTDQIDMSNESSIDLLNKQNKAKSMIANNLNGLGVNANASTDTLEQLAYKVSTAVVDSSRQKIDCLAVGYTNMGTDGKPGFIIKNGWLFLVERDENWDTGLCYVKLSDLKTQLSTYGQNIGYNRSFISLSGTDVSSSNSENILQFSEDGQYLYIKGSSHIYRYSVTWGTNYTTVSFGSRITITPVNSSDENFGFNSFDIKPDNSEILIYNVSSNYLYKLDITNISSDVTIQATQITGNIAGDCKYFYTNTDNQICCFKRDQDNYIFYLFDFVSPTVVNSISYNIFQYSTQGSDYWGVAFNKFKDSNNKYKIIFNVGGLSDTVPSFVIFDCFTKTFNEYYSKVAWTKENDQKNYPVTIYSYNSKYYVLSSIELLIFDSNWNLLGNAINYWDIYSPSFSYSFIYDNEIYALNGDRMEEASRVETYFDKQIAYARTVAIENKPTKQEVYFAQLRKTDLEDGYFDN